MLTLKAERREKKEKPFNLRQKGLIPAVFYGKNEASTPISIKQTDFLKVWKEAGESTVVTIETREGKKESLIQEVDLDPVTGTPRHADFYVFEKGHKVIVSIPLEFVGTAPAIKDLGGALVKVLHELKVEAEPHALLHSIAVDISSLIQFGDQVLAKNIKLPKGVVLKENAEEVVATVFAPREEKEEVAPMDLSQIEVEKKGKEEAPALENEKTPSTPNTP